MFQDADLIFSYSRAQALADGVLIDISAHASLIGFLYPVAVTAGVYAEITAAPTETEQQKRLNTVLLALYQAIVDSPAGQNRLEFTAALAPSCSLPLWSQCGPGDTSDPVLTVMLRHED